jgi:hypothetical protein
MSLPQDEIENSGRSADEDTPLLKAPDEVEWTPPRAFVWIELAIFANVFLYGFDGTVTASTYAVISSEFDAANTASWLTTAYLVTSTAFQPLYGRFSDIFGRRICFFVSNECSDCQPDASVDWLRRRRSYDNGYCFIHARFRSLLIKSIATIINSDMIPFRKRGMYQALQNSMFGFGAICGASFGGAIADSIGWYARLLAVN